MKHLFYGKFVGWVAAIGIAGLLLLHVEETSATEYYFSSLKGNDSNSGTSAASPWKSVAKMQATVNGLKAGDIVYLERGSVWYQAQLDIVNKKGTSSSPIQFKAYGTGAMPVLSGEKILTGGVQSGNIYTFYDAALPKVQITSQSYGRRYLGSVTINGKRYEVSRYPNGDNYLETTSVGSTYLTGDQTWSSNQWQDGFVAVKNVHWQWSSARILSNTSNTLTNTPHITTSSIGNPGGHKFYYILNAYNAMDLPGEWFFKDNQLSVYWPGTIGEVKASVVDTIINISGSDYIHFDSISIRGSNFFGAKIKAGDYNRFNHCKFSDIGQVGVYVYGKFTAPPDPGDSEENVITNCEFSDVNYCSIYFRYCAGGTVSNNYIHRNALENAAHNLIQDNEPNPVHGYAIAMFNNLSRYPMVRRNFIDSTAAGIITHYNRNTINIRENFIRNYGLSELSDIAAFYLVSDTYSSAFKLFKRNIIVDAHMPQGTMENQYTDSYTHAVYFDQDSYAVKGDSNSIENTSAALCTNGGKYRSFKYNNILNPNAFGMHPAHGDAIHHSYNIPLMNGTKAESDTIYGNTFVMGPISTRGYSFWRKSGEYGSMFPINSRIDNNKYFDPKNNSSTVAIIYDQYNPEKSYTIDQWQAASFSAGGSTYNPATQSSYNNTPRSSVKLLKNFSAIDRTFPLGAKYVDVEGSVVEGSVVVPAFYSVILFYVEGDASKDKDIYIDPTLVPALSGITSAPTGVVNRTPAIFEAQFTVNEQDVLPTAIGTVVATDPDMGQSLSYSIVAGNSSGLFKISNQGALAFTTSSVDFTGNPKYNLTVRVQDNGEPPLSDETIVSVSLVERVEQAVDNNSPSIASQTFQTSFDADLNSLIGVVEASDPDAGQTLSYSIESGNSENLFSIDPETGEITLEKFPSNIIPVTYQLIIRVTDDAAEPLFSQAAITIYIMASSLVYYVDPTNFGDELANGTYDHPYSSWSQVSWENEATYLQKRGTIANEEKILITARGITMGDYGSGEKAIINSVATDYAIKAIDKDNVTIKNLKINADLAIGCVYFIGSSCKNNAIENCELIGSDYGLRIIDGSSYVVKYNVFQNDVDGIYSIAQDAEIYYNVFRSNHKAINLSSLSSYAKIYNNVFYDNRQGISASYAEVTMFNNIFYLTQSGDQAINHKLDKLVSNNNIFFPEQNGFLEIEETQYNNLEEYQDHRGLDINSFAGDPLFVDVYTNNFAVSERSRAIDAGRTVGLTQDFYGQTVPYGGGPDIGMSEAPTEAIATSVSYFDADQGEKLLSVYPNPSNGRFNLALESKHSGSTELFINSVNGRQVYYQVVEVNGRFVTEVDLSDLPRGLYYLTAKTADEVLTQKVIIN